MIRDGEIVANIESTNAIILKWNDEIVPSITNTKETIPLLRLNDSAISTGLGARLLLKKLIIFIPLSVVIITNAKNFTKQYIVLVIGKLSLREIFRFSMNSIGSLLNCMKIIIAKV